MDSSWKELTSRVTISRLGVARIFEEKEGPILPQATVLTPESVKSFSTSSVVVVLPLVPVMATIGQGHI